MNLDLKLILKRPKLNVWRRKLILAEKTSSKVRALKNQTDPTLQKQILTIVSNEANLAT